MPRTNGQLDTVGRGVWSSQDKKKTLDEGIDVLTPEKYTKLING